MDNINYIGYIEQIGVKLLSILHTVQGWIIAGLVFLADYIVKHELAVGLVVFVTLIDAAGGTVAVNNIQVVSSMSGSPDNNTLYIIRGT